MKPASSGLATAFALLFLASPALAGSGELGPAPRDGEGRYTNPVGELSHGTFGIRAPFFLRRIA
ncbi:MAG: hypothetical protein ABR538_11970, partial [Candidatus Binatia bacterium]